MKKYRTYSNDFKRQIISEIDSGAITLSSAAREHGISQSLIQRWWKQIHEDCLPERPTAREKQLERELDNYKKKVGELTLQVDLLKKIRKNSQPTRRWNGSVVTIKNLAQSGKGVT